MYGSICIVVCLLPISEEAVGPFLGRLDALEIRMYLRLVGRQGFRYQSWNVLKANASSQEEVNGYLIC